MTTPVLCPFCDGEGFRRAGDGGGSILGGGFRITCRETCLTCKGTGIADATDITVRDRLREKSADEIFSLFIQAAATIEADAEKKAGTARDG